MQRKRVKKKVGGHSWGLISIQEYKINIFYIVKQE